MLSAPYNPTTGEGCYGQRERIDLTLGDLFPDFSTITLYLPVEMMQEAICVALKKYKSFPKLLESRGIASNKRALGTLWTLLGEVRYKYDPEYYFKAVCLIHNKVDEKVIPFVCNRGQRRLLAVLEGLRRADKPIRAILLKARQWGGSTLVQLYLNYIQMIHRKNWNSIICAHVKDASWSIRAMNEGFVENMTPIDGQKYTIRNFGSTQNIKYVPERGCRITVGSAEVPESVRSQDAKLVHFSEVAYFPNTEKRQTSQLISSIVGSVPRVPYTAVIYESTANGVGNFFHQEWLKAEEGDSAYSPVFVPWFEIDIYSEPFNGEYYQHGNGKKVKGSVDDFIATMSDYEKSLFHSHKSCTLESLNWYRGKLSDMTSEIQMRQEFPSDAIEAFQDSGRPVFKSSQIEAMRDGCEPPIAVGLLRGESDPVVSYRYPAERGGILSNIVFEADNDALLLSQSSDPKQQVRGERNKLKIWAYPDTTERYTNRYVVSVDVGGRSDKSDFSVITVLDNYWRMWNGAPEVVAEWIGHIDNDVLVWLSAQVATYYDNALLIFESNKQESKRNEGDHTEFIYDTLSDYYDNLYSRTPPEKVREGVPLVYGFHTNVKTKTNIVNTYQALLRDRGYLEPSHQTLNEARWYEFKQDGKMGAKDGFHDDILMSRMIGLYVSLVELPVPVLIKRDLPRKVERGVSEASI